LLDREATVLSKSLGVCSDGEFSSTWQQCNEDLVYLPHVKKYTLNSMIKNENDNKVRAFKHQFDLVKQDFKRQNKRAKNAEKPLSVYLGGYFKVAEAKEKSIHELQKKIAQTRIELECFKILKDNETLAVPQRIEGLKREVEEQHKQESQLQSTFANLIAKKSEVLELLGAQKRRVSNEVQISQQIHQGLVQQTQPQNSDMDTDVIEGEAPVQHS